MKWGACAAAAEPHLIECAEMKKVIPVIIIFLALFMILPAIADAAWRVALKNGGEFITSHYWSDDGEILLYSRGCVIGIELHSVKTIEKTKSTPRLHAVAPAADSVPTTANQEDVAIEKMETKLAEKGAATKEEEFDIVACQAKMETLKKDLNTTLTIIRQATMENDTVAKQRATEENRRISKEMYLLTDHVKENNDGQLPAGWWDGIGREESQT